MTKIYGELTTIYESLKMAEQRQFDINTTMDQVQFYPMDGYDPFVVTAPQGAEYAKTSFIPSDWAWAQILTKLDMPVKYFTDLWIDHKTVVAEHLAYKSQQMFKDKNLLLRFKKEIFGINRLRACLSDKYSILQNTTIVEHLKEVLKYNEQAELAQYKLTDEHMHIRIIFKGITSRYNELVAGVDIVNSEVGASNLVISGLVYRLVCSNGLRMMIPEITMKKRHYYLAILSDQVKEAIQSISDKGHNMISDFERTKGIEFIDEEPQDILMTISDKFKLSEPVVKRASELVEPSFTSCTAYAIINSLTAAARELSLPDKLQLETIAGDMVYLQEHDWNRLGVSTR